MRNKTIYLIAALFAALAGLLVALWNQNNTTVLDQIKLQDLNQAPYLLKQHKNQTIILNFWATWCPPCIEEMPELNQLYNTTLRAQNIALLGIAIDNPDAVTQFLKRTPVQYPILLGGFNGAELAKQLGNQEGGLPYTVIISPNNQIILKKSGRIDSTTLLNALTLP